jgi:xylulose-5-phosphate/fructose-6-phosphate phosphoketolase
VLPILQLNGYKIANPTVLARIPRDHLEKLCVGYGYKPHFVEGDDPMLMHQQMPATLDTVLSEIAGIQKAARSGNPVVCRQWPMIILRSPNGWTGPKIVDGLKVEGTWRSHQVPFGDMDVALVTYRSVSLYPDGSKFHSLRSSIWKIIDGRWRMAFHQGTLIPH